MKSFPGQFLLPSSAVLAAEGRECLGHGCCSAAGVAVHVENNSPGH